MKNNSLDGGNTSQGLWITALGAAINIALSLVKIVVGWTGHSRALIADGFHSLSDLATDVVVALGLFYGSRPYDADHPYGHKKIETLAEFTTGVLLLAFAVWMVVSSAQALTGRITEAPSLLVPLIAAVSVVSKEWLYRRTIVLANRLQSEAMVANAWHHRSDALTSVVALVAVGLAQISPSLRLLDPVAGIGISILVGKIGFDVAYKGMHRIIDTAPDPQIIERIRQVTIGNEQVRGLHKLRARYLGRQIIADLHIQVDPSLSVQEGHTIASQVEQAISAELGNVYDITVHVEPLYAPQENRT